MVDYHNSLIPTGSEPSKVPARVVGAAAGALASAWVPVVGPIVGAVVGGVFGPKVGFINKAADKGMEQLGKWAGR
jgi:hypothetical protein